MADAMAQHTSAGEFSRRLETVQKEMAADGLDVLVSGDSGDWLPPTGDARYLTGFTIENLNGAIDGVAVVVPRAGTPVLVVPRGPQGNFADWARATAGDVVVVEAAALAEGVGTAVLDLTAAGARVGLGAALPGHTGLEGRLPGRTVVDARAADHTGSGRTPFERARATKSAVELALLRRAQGAADAGMAAFWAAVRPGARNTAIQSLAREAAIAADADAALVIMNAGNDPWMWWTYQGDRRIPDRGVVSVEVNARVAGYCAQLARTGMVGEPDAVQSRLLTAGDASVEAMVKALRPGSTGADVWAAGAAPLRGSGVETWGRLGHGMGLAMDEGVAIVEGDPTQLAEGMVVAVHGAPWDASTRQSGLVGEQYVITKAGPEALSAASTRRAVSPAETETHGGTA